MAHDFSYKVLLSFWDYHIVIGKLWLMHLLSDQQNYASYRLCKLSIQSRYLYEGLVGFKFKPLQHPLFCSNICQDHVSQRCPYGAVCNVVHNVYQSKVSQKSQYHTILMCRYRGCLNVRRVLLSMYFSHVLPYLLPVVRSERVLSYSVFLAIVHNHHPLFHSFHHPALF